jgi:hypothetical protein
MNNDVVMIQLDRPRELRYGHKALKKLSALTGKSMDELDSGSIDFEQIEIFLYCGLLSDARENNETLKLEQMEDLLDEAPSYNHIIEKMEEAFAKSFGSKMDTVPEGNASTPGEKAEKNQNRGTGKQA